MPFIFFFGSYDVPTKGKDKENQWESEEVYQFLIGTISPVTGDYEAGKPEAGFLYPAFANHSTDIDGINIYQAEEGAQLFAKNTGRTGLTERHFFPIIRSGTK